jgi:polysaccharide export outer membrane protein
MSVIVTVLTRSIAIVMVVAMLGACNRYHQAAYFEKGRLDTARLDQLVVPEAIIQKGDLLGITIYSDNPTATAIYNQAGIGSTPQAPAAGVSNSVNTSQPALGNTSPSYMVDQQGQIRLHALGNILAEGLTKDQLAGQITGKLTQLGVLSNPYCIVRFNNFKITVLGEVKSPGVFTLPAEKASILEAIGLAGDFTNFGERDKVMLIREQNGRRSYRVMDLTDPEVFQSPYFYLRQNDVLVIQANPRKPTESDIATQRYVSIAATVISTIAVVVALFK